MGQKLQTDASSALSPCQHGQNVQRHPNQNPRCPHRASASYVVPPTGREGRREGDPMSRAQMAPLSRACLDLERYCCAHFTDKETEVTEVR